MTDQHNNPFSYDQKKLRILMVAPSFPPYNQGGGGIFYKTLVQRLAARGHSITVIAGYYEKGLKRQNLEIGQEKIKIIWIPLMKLAQKKYPQIQESLPPNFLSFYHLRSTFYERYDIVHILAFGHLLVDVLNLLIRVRRKILTVHGFPKFTEREGNADLIIKLFYKIYLETLGKYTLNSATTITTPSDFVSKDCIKMGLSPHKIKTIPNGIDLQSYISVQQFYELEKKYNIMNDDVLILSIGRIVWLKGFEYAIDSLPQVMKVTKKSIKYMIIGPIEDRKYYSKLCEQIGKIGLKDNVIFTDLLGITSQADQNLKLQALSRTNIFLVSSLHESFGFVVLEAMAMGKPIVASNIEGIAAILDNMKTGILVNPSTPEEISRAITILLSNSALCKKLSENAKREVKKYDWSMVVDSYEKIYRQ
jgi:glycosyltransferase involved in cell wall biosynthesis